MTAIKRYLHFAAAYALRAFALSLLIPIWTAHYFGAWEITGKTTWFLVMIDSLIRAAERERRASLFDYYWEELAKLVGVLFVGAAVGLIKARQWVRSH